MRVVAHLPLYPLPDEHPAPRAGLVGAWLTTHEFLRHLVARGHQVDVVTFLTGEATYELDGITVHPRRTHLEADLVVGHAGDKGHAARLADGRPLVTMVHGPMEQPRRVLAKTTLAVFNSYDTARRCAAWPGPSIVARPPVDPARYRTTPGDLVTMVNLSSAKGGERFWRIAEAMPDVEFLAVLGGYGSQVVRTLPNVTVIDPTADMRAVYAQTRILLTPSTRESWGRTAVEAACCGIPVISAPTAGAQEALGDAGIFCDRHDLPAWIDTIRHLLADQNAWDAASEAVWARFYDHLDPSGALDAFADAVEAIVDPPSAAVLIPWRDGGCEHRQANWRHVRRMWADRGYLVLPADDGGTPFSRGGSINLAAELVAGDVDVLILADADTIIDDDQVRSAITAAAAQPGLVVAFDRYRYLTRPATDIALAGDVARAARRQAEFTLERTVSSVVAVSRSTWEAAGGFDPRFRAWGHEDIAFEAACATLAGPTRWIPGPVHHLWHPTEANRPAANEELAAAYGAARSNPTAMRALVAEASHPARAT